MRCHFHEGTGPDGADYSVPCPLEASQANGMCTQCGFIRDSNEDAIQEFIDTEMEQAQLIVDADPFLKARFSGRCGIGEIHETFSNGAYDRAPGDAPDLDGVKQWTGMQICWTTELASEAETYNSATRIPHEGLLEYLMACVLLCNRMIEHHTSYNAYCENMSKIADEEYNNYIRAGIFRPYSEEDETLAEYKEAKAEFMRQHSAIQEN